MNTMSKTDINLAENTILAYIAKYYEKDLEHVKELYKTEGDLGQVASTILLFMKAERPDFNGSFKQNPITVEDIIDIIYKIKAIQGQDSYAKKYYQFQNILKTEDPLEVKFIIKVLMGSLRIGVSAKSLIKILQELQTKDDIEDPKPIENLLIELEKEVFGYTIRENPDFLNINTPVHAMLGRSAKTFKDLTKFITDAKKVTDKRALSEYKYDGERSQIHYDGEKINMFSRGHEIQNFKFYALHETLEEYFNRIPGLHNCILDGEVLFKQFEGETSKIISFQEIEKKTKNRTEFDGKYPSLYLFDIMQLNGVNLINEDILTRKQYLDMFFDLSKKEKLDNPDQLNKCYSKIIDFTDPAEAKKEIDAMMKGSLASECEGLFLKLVDKSLTSYDISGSNRTQWIKYKGKAISKGLSDSLDLIPVGAYYGKGRRTGMFGSYLMATYDPDQDVYYTLCKVGTGFKDMMLKDFTTKFEKEVVPQKLPNVVFDSASKTMEPDVWVNPSQVWEISADSFSNSKNYTLGEGIYASLRFPRFVRQRDDKGIRQSSNVEQVKQMYKEQ
ncbi:unnamed protein product [Moneuplotes crassus]|uniref:DNA ligase 1 n=1 Tax=Euplotes crassus TaxID=5936 RepID=A0AAD1Y7L8_EUPCR|nr:unnamed protein product [Moneuplotes crassus]